MSTNNTIDTAAFVERMTAHWTRSRAEGGLDNHVSPKLQKVWAILADTFSGQITQSLRDESRTWDITAPSTGSGKSQGLAVYCSMLAEQRPEVGVLIVSRMKQQASDMAETINRLSGSGVAVAKHTDSKIDPAEQRRSQVLCITHAAFGLLMDKSGSEVRKTYHEWSHGPRLLTVIDESLELVDEARVDLDAIHQLGMIPSELLDEHGPARSMIKYYQSLLTRVSKLAKKGEGRDRITWKGLEDFLEREDDLAVADRAQTVLASLSELRQACSDVSWDTWIGDRRDEAFGRAIRQKVAKTLYAMEQTIANWSHYTKEGKRHSLNSARLVVPDFVKGAVVLDATANLNLMWELFEDRTNIVPIPFSPRRYANVTLHVLPERGLGKHSMTQKVDDSFVRKIVASIAAHGRNRKVLVVTNKAVAYRFAGAGTSVFEDWDVAHYGALDGLNDWDDFNTIVLVGLQYRPWPNSANLFMALQGLQDDTWLNDPSARCFNSFEDVRKSIRQGQLAADVVQAVNRICCRRVIDAEGNCPPADVFLAVPPDRDGEYILSAIEREMPGIRRDHWDYNSAGARRKCRRDFAAALVKYLDAQPLGRIPATEVRKAVGIKRDTWKSLASACKGNAPISTVYHGLDRELTQLGITFVPGSAGKGNGAVFEKRSKPTASVLH